MVLVDDHQVFAQALRDTLVHQGIDVVGVANRLRPVRGLVDRLRPQVVVMDVRLPDGDGTRATAELTRRSPDTRVLLLSASSGPELLAQAVESGAAGFLPKTASLPEVVDGIRQIAAGHVLFTPIELRSATTALRDRDVRSAELTAREREVLQLLAEPCSTEEIARRLVISRHTVRNHVRNLMAKLGVHTKLEAVTLAIRNGWVAPVDGVDGRSATAPQRLGNGR
ncbi:response regulator [Egicoccus sp. AB-alg2]|uniref:response regulator n=1 Tax=Egicoccus sp. AB-alg2 TaxID=3242693 RepID=UPI00359E3487